MSKRSEWKQYSKGKWNRQVADERYRAQKSQNQRGRQEARNLARKRERQLLVTKSHQHAAERKARLCDLGLGWLFDN